MSRAEEFIDPLYGLVTISEPFTSTMLRPALQKEIQRLRGIRSLGLIFHRFPAGTHTKWEHYLGMYYVAEQLQRGISKSEREDLQWLCLLGGIGHLPCTYATASAVLLAARLSAKFSKELRDLIKPANIICSRCDEKDICENQPLNLVFKTCDIRALRQSLSAYKIRLLPRDIDIGNRDSLVRECICPKDKLYRIYQAISRYDYMQRDLYHTGVAKFSIGSKETFKKLADGINALEESPHMKLLDQLYNYLVDTLYLRPDVACMEALFTKALAEKLCQGAIGLAELLDCNDDSLIHKLEKFLEADFGATLTRRSPIFTIKRDISLDSSASVNNFNLEARLLGLKSKQIGDLLTYPDTYGLAVSVYNMGESSEEFETLYRVMLNVLKENKELYPIMAVAFNLQSEYLPRNMQWNMQTVAKLGQEILSYAFGNRE